MSSSRKYQAPPPEPTGFRIFIRNAYSDRYNFAVANYNSVSIVHKSTMFGSFLVLYRSVVAVIFLISLAFAILAFVKAGLVIPTVIFSLIYIAVSIYNAYVFCNNRDVLNSPRLLRANIAGPSGADHEWVMVPIDSRSANERLAAVNQVALDNVRREYAGTDKSEVECLVYTKRYADRYTSFPKELLLHLFGFLLVIILGIIMAIL